MFGKKKPSSSTSDGSATPPSENNTSISSMKKSSKSKGQNITNTKEVQQPIQYEEKSPKKLENPSLTQPEKNSLEIVQSISSALVDEKSDRILNPKNEKKHEVIEEKKDHLQEQLQQDPQLRDLLNEILNLKKTTQYSSNEKKKIIQETAFNQVATWAILGTFAFILYYNYVMSQYYLTPILLAFLIGLPLSILKDRAIVSMKILDDYRKKFIEFVLGLNLVYFFLVYFFSNFAGFISIIIPIDLFFFAWLASDRNTSTTLFLVLLLCFLVAFPLVFWIRACVGESTEATQRIVAYLSNDPDLKDFLEKYKYSYLFEKVSGYAASWGYDINTFDTHTLTDQLSNAISTVGSNINIFFDGALGIAQNIGNFLSSVIIFLSTLYFIVESSETLVHKLYTLSPFTDEDQKKILHSLRSSISKIFLSSIAVATLNFWVTYLSFWIAGLDLINIFGAVSAFLSTVPFLGNWILWVPASFYLIFQSNYVSYFYAFLIAFTHIIAGYIIQPKLYTFIPGNPFYVSLSIVLGISSFGVVGFIYGPLLASLLLTYFDILETFYSS